MMIFTLKSTASGTSMLKMQVPIWTQNVITLGQDGTSMGDNLGAPGATGMGWVSEEG